jgi:hypothetical protein
MYPATTDTIGAITRDAARAGVPTEIGGHDEG